MITTPKAPNAMREGVLEPLSVKICPEFILRISRILSMIMFG